LTSTTIAVGSRAIHLVERGQRVSAADAARRRTRASGVSNYSRNIAALARRFRVLVPDLPGYGKSTRR